LLFDLNDTFHWSCYLSSCIINLISQAKDASMNELPDYQQAQLLLEKNEIFVTPAEAHGVISGLLACG